MCVWRSLGCNLACKYDIYGSNNMVIAMITITLYIYLLLSLLLLYLLVVGALPKGFKGDFLRSKPCWFVDPLGLPKGIGIPGAVKGRM